MFSDIGFYNVYDVPVVSPCGIKSEPSFGFTTDKKISNQPNEFFNENSILESNDQVTNIYTSDLFSELEYSPEQLQLDLNLSEHLDFGILDDVFKDNNLAFDQSKYGLLEVKQDSCTSLDDIGPLSDPADGWLSSSSIKIESTGSSIASPTAFDNPTTDFNSRNTVLGSVYPDNWSLPSPVKNGKSNHPFGSNTAPSYPVYNRVNNSPASKARPRVPRKSAVGFRPKKPLPTAPVVTTVRCCTSPPSHRHHGQTERERRAQENKRMRNIEGSIRQIAAFRQQSRVFFPRERSTKERTLKACKALLNFFHNSSIELENNSLRSDIDGMKQKLSLIKAKSSAPLTSRNSTSPSTYYN